MLPDRSTIDAALRQLAKQAGALECARFTPVETVVAPASPACLPPPALVLLATDGRAIAWYGEHRPFLVHPTLDDLASMHGLARAPLATAA